jgi:pyruvate dehydrogenase (quinone)
MRIYGVVGDSLNPIVDAIRRSEGIEWVHVRHEESAAFAAAAEAQVTGRLAVCAGSCGPGKLITDPNALFIPPKVTAAQVRGFTLGILIDPEDRIDPVLARFFTWSQADDGSADTISSRPR